MKLQLLKAQRSVCDRLAQKLNIQMQEDWYKRTSLEIRENISRKKFHRSFKSSLYRALINVYPEFTWYPWLLDSAPRNIWKDISNHRKFFDWTEEELGIETKEDWYTITKKQVEEKGGGALLAKYYGDSLTKALETVYQESLHPWNLRRMPRNFWTTHENQKKFMDWLGQKMNVKEPDDWYKVTVENFVKNGGEGLLRHCESSIPQVFETVYPERKWLHWRFAYTPKGFWQDTDNHRKFFDWIGEQIGIRKMDDWYKTRVAHLREAGGHAVNGVLRQYGDSLQTALQSVYSDYKWIPWLFVPTIPGLFSEQKMQRDFLEWFEKERGMKEQDWYQVKMHELKEKGAESLLSRYDNSIYKMLSSLFPERTYHFWLFPNSPSTWNDETNIQFYTKWLASRLDIKNATDWYDIPNTTVVRNGGNTLLNRFSLVEVLKKSYPQVAWNPKQFFSFRKAEEHLIKLVRRLFPNESTAVQAKLPFSTNPNVILSILIDSKSFGFQYQGEHCFQHYPSFHKTEEAEKIDNEMKEECKKTGITLVEVPYWWDNTIESLAATIYKLNPSLFSDKPKAFPIPAKPFDRSSVHAENILDA